MNGCHPKNLLFMKSIIPTSLSLCALFSFSALGFASTEPASHVDATAHHEEAAHAAVADSHANVKGGKPSPDEVVQMLKEGNERFYTGHATYPHLGPQRFYQAGTENQGNHAYATVISCSDSRVPVELIFDAGIMDIFVIRVAGNVCDTDELGSIEYGLAHVNTPVLVVLGHTQCGAVTAVTHEVQGRGHKLEKNIPPLVDNIIPAVKRTIHTHDSLSGDEVIPFAIEENVWQGIRDLAKNSPDSVKLIREGKAKVVGAIYDVSTGKVEFLPQEPVVAILQQALGKKKATRYEISGKSSSSTPSDDEDRERRFARLRE